MLRDIGMLLRSRIASHLGHGSDVNLIDTTPMLKTSLCHSQVRFASCGKKSGREAHAAAGKMCRVLLILFLPCCALQQDHIYCRILAQAAVDAAFAGEPGSSWAARGAAFVCTRRQCLGCLLRLGYTFPPCLQQSQPV